MGSICRHCLTGGRSEPTRFPTSRAASKKPPHADVWRRLLSVMAGLVPAIHVFLLSEAKTWMPEHKAGHDVADATELTSDVEQKVVLGEFIGPHADQFDPVVADLHDGVAMVARDFHVAKVQTAGMFEHQQCRCRDRSR